MTTTSRGYARVARRFSARIAPLGINLTVEADDLALLDAVASIYRRWEPLGGPASATLHIALELGPSLSSIPPTILVDGPRLIVRGCADAWADASSGLAWCRIPSLAVLDDPVFRERVIDSLILWLVTHHDRTPLHAAAFMAGGMAIILAGRSGSGKSCLARAADKAGFRLMTDDTVYVETGNRFRIWSMERPIHLYPEDSADQVDVPIRLRNGKRKRAVEFSPTSYSPTADAAVLCVLRQGDKVALDRIDRSTSLALLGPHEPGFDLLSDAVDAVLHRMTQYGSWRLTLGGDPHEAIRVLAANMSLLIERSVS